MSAVDTSQGVMNALLMRSSTPAINEKVLLYLESMEKAPPDEDGSSVSSQRVRSPIARSVTSSARHLEELASNHPRSDIQEGSEMERTIPIHTTGIPEHEPGPDDPPGPHFESYGSSFGNFGPLPQNGGPLNAAQPTTPRATGAPLLTPANVIPASPSSSHRNPFQQWGMTPATAAGVPLPASQASPSSRNGADQPVSALGSRSRQAASRKSPSALDAQSNGLLSPKSMTRALSPNRTVGERPFSPPRSMASHGPSSKSRGTQRTNRTQYPPLPESALETNLQSPTLRSPSPPPRTHNRSPSIAPSDSASQRSVRSTVHPLPAKSASQKPSKSIKSTLDTTAESTRGGPSRHAHSQAPMSPYSQASQMPRSSKSKAPTNDELTRAASTTTSKRSHHDPEATPTPSRPQSPDSHLNPEEEQMVNNLLVRPIRDRTSYAPSGIAPSTLEPDIQNSHYHDKELCQLLHALDEPMGEPVKKAVRKAVRARVKKLGMKYDNESIKQYRKSFHDHDPGVHLIPPTASIAASSKRSMQFSQEPPEWAKDLIDGVIDMRERFNDLAPKIEYVVSERSYQNGHHQYPESNAYTRTPASQSVNMPQPTGTMGDESMFQPGDTDMIGESTHGHTLPGSVHRHDGSLHNDDLYADDLHRMGTDGDTRGISDYTPGDRQDSPGQQYLEDELYKLRSRPAGSQAATHRTWEVTRDTEGYDEDAQIAVTESGLPEIPDANTGGYTIRGGSPPLPPLPSLNHDSRGDLVSMPDAQIWRPAEYQEPQGPPPWQRIHQRLLNWAMVWTHELLDNALNSTTRGNQVDATALSIWTTQTYKRYVRAKITDSPPGRVDRLFVPPHVADAINDAVFHGRHGDACGMLRDLWAPFGLEGIPRLLLVLVRHRNDPNHWIAHRFSLPDGTLTTYDTSPVRDLPDGRPLGWWFAIRIAWEDKVYQSPDHLMQRVVRLHRPMQLEIDNAVSAAGIWRNILMGSRAERSLDLERLRDLMNTEVKNLRQRKLMGKLSVGLPRPNWEDMN